MIELTIIVQWLHVLFAIAWFGSSIFTQVVTVPAVGRMSDAGGGEYLHAMHGRSRPFFTISAIGTVLLGVVRGLLFGVPLGTPYGTTFLVATGFGLLVLVYGARITGPNITRLVEADAARRPEMLAAVRRYGSVELGGFAVLLVLMILMRFGY